MEKTKGKERGLALDGRGTEKKRKRRREEMQ